MFTCSKSALLIISVLVLIGSTVFKDDLNEILTKVTKSEFTKDVTEYILNTLKSVGLLSVTPSKTSTKSSILPDRIFTAEELKSYNGQKGSKGLFLALLGLVFDVNKSPQHYGPDGGYEFFAGRDASRAFVSGDFTEAGLIDDVTGLSSQDFLGLEEWVKFYLKDYKYVGKLEGRFYDQSGISTKYNKQVQGWIKEAHAAKKKDDRLKKIFPGCNSEWSPEKGTRLYCTARSGGVERNWVGVPRRYFEPGRGKQERCVCVKTNGPPSHDPSRDPHLNRGDLDHPNLKEYPNCVPDSDTCRIPAKA